MAGHASPALLNKLNKDGTFELDEEEGSSLKTCKLIFFQKTMYKSAYRGEGIHVFAAKGMKVYDNELLVHIKVKDMPDSEDRLFAYNCPYNAEVHGYSPKLFDINKTHTSWKHGVKPYLAAQQILTTPDSLIFLETKTIIGGSCRAR